MLHAPPARSYNAKISSRSLRRAGQQAQDRMLRKIRSNSHKYVLSGGQHVFTVDSGATVHCVKDKSLLATIDPSKRVQLKVADGRVVTSDAIGTAPVKLLNSTTGRLEEIILHNVVYHPSFSHNLLSVRRLWQDSRIAVQFDDRNYLQCYSSGGRYRFTYDNGYKLHSAMSASFTHHDFDTIHRRFGHCGHRRIRKMVSRSRNFPNFNGTFEHDPASCDACMAGGGKKKPFPRRASQQFTYFGQRLSSDLCGPFPVSVDGYKYALVIVDAATNFAFLHLLSDKSATQVRDGFDIFLKHHKHQLHVSKPTTWHTDNGGEFLNADLDAFCEEFAIRRSFSVPYCPPQNASAERMWGVLLTTVRKLLAQSGMNHKGELESATKFWSYAIKHACRLHNALPSSRLQDEISPYQALTNRQPDASRYKVWGCIAWYLLEKKDRTSKISPVSVPSIHLGLDPERKGHVVYVPYLNRITTSYHLQFQESKFASFSDSMTSISGLPASIDPLRKVERTYAEKRDRTKAPVPAPLINDESSSADETPDNNQSADKCKTSGCTLAKHPTNVQHSFHKGCQHPMCSKPPHPDLELHSFQENLPNRRGGRGAPQQHDDHDAHPDEANLNLVTIVFDDVAQSAMQIDVDSLISDVQEPNNYEQAIASDHHKEWHASMTKEWTELLSNNTFHEPVDRSSIPSGRKVTKSRWVYKVKLNKDGSIERYKSRFVVCGYSQVKGVDYTKSFSATLRSSSLRTMIALAAGQKLKLEHFDVTNAFTQSEIDSDIYIDPPKGFATKGSDGLIQVLKLKRALYGTKQASHLFQETLRTHLVEGMGFKNSTADPCLFSKCNSKTGDIIRLAVYVDDIVVAHNSSKLLDWFKAGFKEKFKSNHLGPLSRLLGIGVDRHADGSITLNQEQYVQKLIEKVVA